MITSLTLAALMLATADHATTILKRENCAKDCSSTVTLLTASLPSDDARRELVDLACLRNPILVTVLDTTTGKKIQGVFGTTRLTNRMAGKPAASELPIFLKVREANDSPVFIGAVCPPPISSGYFSEDNVLVEPVPQVTWSNHGLNALMQERQLHAAGKSGSRRRPESTFSLRKLSLELIDELTEADKPLAALSPANWLLKWESTGNRQLVFRSTPPGARLLLDGIDLGLATETPLSIERGAIAGLALKLGNTKIRVSDCRILPQRNLASDGIVDCDLRPKPR